MNKLLLFCLLILYAQSQNIVKGDYGYLYCHMSDLGEYTAYAISRDGYNYEDILDGKAIMDVNEHARIEGGQRDAYITRDYTGNGFVMVNTVTLYIGLQLHLISVKVLLFLLIQILRVSIRIFHQ